MRVLLRIIIALAKTLGKSILYKYRYKCKLWEGFVLKMKRIASIILCGLLIIPSFSEYAVNAASVQEVEMEAPVDAPEEFEGEDSTLTEQEPEVEALLLEGFEDTPDDDMTSEAEVECQEEIPFFANASVAFASVALEGPDIYETTRVKTVVSSLYQKRDNGDYKEYAIDDSTQKVRISLYEAGEKKMDFAADLNSANFTNGRRTWGGMSTFEDDKFYSSGEFTVWYDESLQEFYFEINKYVQRAYQVLYETYAPENCLDTGAKNIKMNGLPAKARSYYGCGDEKLDEIFRAIQAEAISVTAGCETDYQKVKMLSEWMKSEITYYDRSSSDYIGYPDHEVANPYIIWDTKVATCYGYAQLMELMLQAVNVPCITVRGYRGGSHVWNMVYVEGAWETLDPTNLKSVWESSFLPSREYASMCYAAYHPEFLPNMIDGTNLTASQVVSLGHDVIKVNLDTAGGVSRLGNAIYVTANSGYRYSNLENPTRIGYTFDGWYDNAGYTGTKYFRTTSVTKTANHTLYAKWTPHIITFNKPSLVMEIGEQQTLTASITPSTVVDKTITWSSSNPAIATVATNGRVVAINAGTATITATGADTSASCIVTVRSTHTLSGTDIYTKTYGSGVFNLDTRVIVGDGNLKFTSSNQQVVTVNNSGAVTIVGVGNAKITVTASETAVYKPATKEISITITKAAQSILAQSVEKTYGSKAFSLGAEVVKGNGTLIYQSSNTKVVTVSNVGTVTIIGAGKATINMTARETNNYKSATKTISITVAKADQNVTTNTIANKVYGDSPFSLNAKRVTGDGQLTYVSSNKNIITVDNKGIVTIVGAGNAIITITASETNNYKSLSKSIAVTIGKGNQNISSNSFNKTYGNRAFALGAKRTHGDGSLTYKSSDNKVATISSSGKVTIKSTGKVTIAITAAETANYAQKVVNVTITVKPKKATLSSVKSSSKAKATVAWKRDSKANGYQIQYSTSSSFKNGNKTKVITKNSTLKTTLSKLQKGKKYYVRIRSYKTIDGQKVYGAWSTKKTVKIK